MNIHKYQPVSIRFKKYRLLVFSAAVVAVLFFASWNVNSAQAAITLRGTAKIGSDINGNDVTLTFDTTGGNAPLPGDVVIFFGGHGCDCVCTAIGPITSWYTLATSTDGADVQVGVWYKVMGDPPDLTVQGEGGGDTGDAVAYGAYIIDGTTLDAAIFDQTAVKVAQVTGVPAAPSIVTQTAEAMVIAVAGGHLTDATTGTVSGYTNDLTAAPGDTDDITLAAATKIVASPATENPGAWSTWTSANYIAITVALKPAPSTPNLTQIHYRWRNNDGDETGASWAQATNTPITNVSKQSVQRLRLEISNEGGATSTGAQYRLEYATSDTTTASAWTQVGTSSASTNT